MPDGRPHRIAMIAGQLVVGGAERQLYLWLSHLDRSRFEPLVITLKAAPGDYWEDRIRAIDIPLVRESHSGNPPLRLASLTRLLWRWRADLVHAWHLFASPYAGAAGRVLGVPSIGSLRSSACSFRAQRLESRLTEGLVDAMVVNSSTAASQLADWRRCRRQRVFVVPNAVESSPVSRADARAHLAAALRLDTQDAWIGTMGRMVDGKGFDTLLDVVSAVRRHRPDTSLIFFGDGPLRPALEARARELGVTDRVRFAGEDPTARRWLGGLDAFCFLSEDEGMPNAVLEAACAGAPLLGWRTAFLQEALTPDAHAVLVAPGDVAAFAAALHHVLDHPDEAARRADAARAHVSCRFGIAQYVDHMSAAYANMLRVAPRQVRVPA